MEPARKKQRVVEMTPPSNDVVAMDTSTLSSTLKDVPPLAAFAVDDLWSAHEKAIDQLLSVLEEDADNVVPPNDSDQQQHRLLQDSEVVMDSWFQLKSIQRHILTLLADSVIDVETKRQALERSSAVLDNILYEQTYWQQQIQQCQAFATPQLEQMCRDEQQQQQQQQKAPSSAQPEATSTTTTTTTLVSTSTATHTPTMQDVMNSFLCQSTTMTTETETEHALSFTDPHHKTCILQKLHQELHLRGTLERDWNDLKRQLKERKRVVQSKHVLLNDLPSKLHDMERSSRALQRLFHSNQTNNNSSNNNNNNNSSTTVSNSNPSTVHLIGTERRERLDLAQLLPGPLYTLFVHLQHVLDTMATTTTATNTPRNVSLEVKPTPTTTAIATAATEQELVADRVVLLHIPIPEVMMSATAGGSLSSASNTNKKVTIQFSYLLQSRLVTAKTSYSHGSSGESLLLIDSNMLLDQLFPGDSGDYAVVGSNLPSTAAATTATAYGKPYHWCNYMAGLHFPSEQQQHQQAPSSSAVSTSSPSEHLKRNQQASARVVLREVMRRTRAQVVLAYVLSSLRLRKPHPIPVHTAMESYFAERDPAEYNNDVNHETAATAAASVVARLVKFQETSTAATTDARLRLGQRTFAFTIQKASSNCQGTVTIDTIRYPAVPPVWSLLSATTTTAAVTTALAEQATCLSSLQDGTNAVYDEGLAKLERSINEEALETLIQPDMEETFDWILAHQLRRLVQIWEQWNRQATSDGGGSARVFRGRDRTSTIS